MTWVGASSSESEEGEEGLWVISARRMGAEGGRVMGWMWTGMVRDDAAAVA